MNYITLRQLASLALELNMHVGMLELKLEECNIAIKKTESHGFRSNRCGKRRCMLELY